MSNPKTRDKKIRTIEQLKQLAKKNNGLNYFILLNGCLRSSKHINYYHDDNIFYALNLVDDSEQELTEAQLLDSDYTNIGQALKNGCLFMD